MTNEEMSRLRPGMVVHHRTLGRHMVVAVDEAKVSIVYIRDLDKPEEWHQVDPPLAPVEPNEGSRPVDPFE